MDRRHFYCPDNFTIFPFFWFLFFSLFFKGFSFSIKKDVATIFLLIYWWYEPPPPPPQKKNFYFSSKSWSSVRLSRIKKKKKENSFSTSLRKRFSFSCFFFFFAFKDSRIYHICVYGMYIKCDFMGLNYI